VQATTTANKIVACIQMAALLARSFSMEGADSLAKVLAQASKSREHVLALMGSTHYGHLALIMLAVQTQLLLQVHLPVTGVTTPGSSSSSRSSSSSSTLATVAAMTAPAVPYHLQLWQDLRLPRTLLDQAVIAACDLAPDAASARASFLSAAAAAVSTPGLLAGLENYRGQPATAADLSSQQMQLIVMAMRMPLLLMDVAQRAINILSSSLIIISSSTAWGSSFDRDFTCIVIEAAQAPVKCWRLLAQQATAGQQAAAAQQAVQLHWAALPAAMRQAWTLRCMLS
jgi:hypothetical protein